MSARFSTLLLALALSGVAHAGGDPAKKVAGRDMAWLLKKLPKAAGDAALRAALLSEMGARRDPAALPHLLHGAGDSDRTVRVAALQGLAAFGPLLADPQRDSAYVVALQDPAPSVVRAARAGLDARLQAAAQPGLDGLLQQLARLAKTGRTWQTRKAAIELLERVPADFGGADLNTALTELARTDAHPEVRRAACVALGIRGVKAAGGVLQTLKNTDPDATVRMAAEDALDRVGGPALSTVLAVLPFEATHPSLRSFAVDLQDYFTQSLSAAAVAQVVERRQVSAVMTELHFQDAHVDDGRALQVGQMLRASMVVTGAVQLRGDEVTCLAKRIDVATGEVAAAQPVVGATHDLAAVQRACANRFVRSF